MQVEWQGLEQQPSYENVETRGLVGDVSLNETKGTREMAEKSDAISSSSKQTIEQSFA